MSFRNIQDDLSVYRVFAAANVNDEDEQSRQGKRGRSFSDEEDEQKQQFLCAKTIIAFQEMIRNFLEKNKKISKEKYTETITQDSVTASTQVSKILKK